ncbi:putative EGF-like domain-containing protein-like protein [Skeletonema marinoi]|uniref:EGF-like domain-containing protein-like protein n=1 Tax=Skeletonema marinoi TaxID=267567 RepID=A0AAD8Y9Z9_9STRA|nr:putative EGF-like domain-containing protein-like protein [Skeletonema marinoi]|eukprot:scaffold20882_cov139-Skeletonema_marinoi.AAC.7
MNSQSLGSGELPSGTSGRLVFRSTKTNDANSRQPKDLHFINHQHHYNDLEVNGNATPQGAFDDTKEESDYSEPDPIELTQSTHSLLFSEPINSLPYAFALMIVLMSYTCLFLACYNNMQGGSDGNRLNVPFGVEVDVRVAQYLSLIIGLIMEEEIPSALFMLRQIPKTSLRQTAPQITYGKFAFAAIVRLTMGYFFLINMFLVVVQAKAVLDIFYDVIALQFLQQLDDICFTLAKMDVFGKRLKKATTRKCFSVEFPKLPFARRKKLSLFVKALYLINIVTLLIGMALINVKQDSGTYYCASISVYLGDHIWEEAVVYNNNSTIIGERMNLIFSYFNGEYIINGTTKNGRPIYVEQNKYNSEPFIDKVPAQIRYCASEQAWVFIHPNIRKSSSTDYNEECPWLLKSSETTEFNLLEVGGDWKIWTGTVSNGADFQVFCNECDGEVDCNYRGQCVDKRCQCDSTNSEFEGELEGYFGSSCQFKKPCLQMQGDMNDTWRIAWVDIAERKPFFSYDRPVYVYESGWKNLTIPEGDIIIMIYGGSRWFGAYYEDTESMGLEGWVDYVTQFHAFWDKIYTDQTKIVSDPTTSSSPIGSDFYMIGKRGERYGPFGELNPLSDPPGSGFFDCIEMNTTAHLIYVAEQLIYNQLHNMGQN